MKRLADLRAEIEPLARLAGKANELDEFIALDEDGALDAEVASELERLRTDLDIAETTAIFDGEFDSHGAILTIHAGAGGTEAMDWAEMLLRMYMRWAERHGFRAEIVDSLEGEEAGIKSATVVIEGRNAYGYLESERGVHRLVRISPFDAAKRRHTSFASVYVSPEIDEDIEIKIDDKDLRVDTYRSSGAGGQHVNVTDSAVRITHLPT